MASATTTATNRFAGFRRAEEAVWDHFRLRPSENLVRTRNGRVVRLHEVGSGAPILFVHGSGGSGAYWAPLVKELAPHFRCILIDRPGWTLSTPVDYSDGDFGATVASLQGDLLDSLEVSKAHVVGGSIGDVYALRFAQYHPDRVLGLVLVGGGPLTTEVRPPTFIRLLRSPLGQLMVRIPQKPGMVRKQMEGLGHKASLDQGQIPNELIDLYSATSRHTDALRNERDLVRSVLDRRGWVPGFTFSRAELQDISAPTLMVYGSDDPVGSVEMWTQFVRAMPSGAIHVVSDAGHLNWYDKPEEVGARIGQQLNGGHA